MGKVAVFIFGLMIGAVVGVAILIFFQSIKENEEEKDCEQTEWNDRQDSGED